MADNGHRLREEIARTLSAERQMEKATQGELAEKIGTAKSNISRIESGRQNMSVDYIELIADALGKDAKLILRDRRPSYKDSEEYSLKLYDDVLVRFTMKRSGHGFDIDVLGSAEEKKELLPPDLELTPDGIIEWLGNRSIPSDRELVGDILSSLGLEPGDIKGIVDVCFALSLNDSYWVTPEGFDGKFAEYDLYENEFSSALSLIAYAGYGSPGRGFQSTPELTTGGMLRKAWRYFDEGGIWLYKSGTSRFANTGNEPYSEFYASQVAEAMGIDHVGYELENWCHILASKCRLFTDINTSFVPIGRIVKEGGIGAVIEYYKELGDEYYQNLASMLCFDAVIINEDRHFNNFGLLRDSRTGKIKGAAPVFDNGNSLLCYAVKEDFDKGIDSYIAGRTNPYGYGNGSMELAKRTAGPLQKKQLRRLIGFRFRESDVSNLPTWRLKALEKVIQDRVKELLK